MGLGLSIHESGLVLAEQTQGEAGLRRALKSIDGRLKLLSPEMIFPGTAPGYWRVVCQWSNDHPAVPVITWMDGNGDPAPLTSRILDEVKRHRMGERGYGKTADEKNADLKESVAKERADAVDALHGEYAAELERGKVGVSMAARSKIPYWQRKSRGGYID